MWAANNWKRWSYSYCNGTQIFYGSGGRASPWNLEREHLTLWGDMDEKGTLIFFFFQTIPGVFLKIKALMYVSQTNEHLNLTDFRICSPPPGSSGHHWIAIPLKITRSLSKGQMMALVPTLHSTIAVNTFSIRFTPLPSTVVQWCYRVDKSHPADDAEK